MPPIGNADHDIVFTECSISLKRNKKPARQICQFKKANWENIKSDIQVLEGKIKTIYNTSNTNELWQTFKEDLIKTISTNIPQKQITHKMKLPWITDQLRIKINKTKRLHKKSKKNHHLQIRYKHMKKTLQADMRSAYWHYIENMILDLPIEELGTTNKKNTPKNLFSYIKSMRNDNSGEAALKKDGLLVTNTKDKANILNQQFQKAFSTESSADPIPVKNLSSHPQMNEIKISEKGVNKLLHNINPNKATGPDELCGKVLKE